MDLLHIIGYAGAIGSLAFGINQLRIILVKHEAKDVSVLDYVIRIAYSTLLGIYAAGKSDVPFAIVGLGGAAIAVAVTIAAAVMKRRNARSEGSAGGSRRQTSTQDDSNDGAAAA